MLAGEPVNALRRNALLTMLGAALAGCGVQTRTPSLPERALAPDFALHDQSGGLVTLSSLTKGSLAVVVFYRGHW